MDEFCRFLFGVLLVLFGFYLLKRSFDLRKDWQESLNWPSVIGVIKSNSASKGVDSTGYHIHVVYDYAVDSKQYQAYRPFLYSVTAKEKTLQFMERFPAGSHASIYYKPGKPQQAVLVPGGRQEKQYSEVIGSIFVIFLGLGSCYVSVNEFIEKMMVTTRPPQPKHSQPMPFESR